MVKNAERPYNKEEIRVKTTKPAMTKNIRRLEVATLDMCSGYNQIAMNEESSKLFHARRNPI